MQQQTASALARELGPGCISSHAHSLCLNCLEFSFHPCVYEPHILLLHRHPFIPHPSTFDPHPFIPHHSTLIPSPLTPRPTSLHPSLFDPHPFIPHPSIDLSFTNHPGSTPSILFVYSTPDFSLPPATFSLPPARATIAPLTLSASFQRLFTSRGITEGIPSFSVT